MKDLSKKVREGGVQKFNGSQVGISRNGKGSFHRFSYLSDEKYKEKYNKIDWKK